MNTNKLIRLSAKLQTAHEDVIEEMRRLWPHGTEIQFTLRRGQRNPTFGRVIGHFREHVTVTLRTVNSRGYHTVKRVWWRTILP